MSLFPLKWRFYVVDVDSLPLPNELQVLVVGDGHSFAVVNARSPQQQVIRSANVSDMEPVCHPHWPYRYIKIGNAKGIR